MSLPDVGTGSVVTPTNFTHHTPNLQLSFKAPKGKKFVMLLLGVQDKDDQQPLDVIDVMKRLGWTHEDEAALRAENAL
jgi:hypothetical protein